MKIVSNNIDEIHSKILESLKLSGDLTSIIPELKETIKGLIDEKFITQKGWESLKVRNGQALSDTSSLVKSIQVDFKQEGNKWIIELSELGYGKFHEYGAKITVTAKSKKFFWAKYKETGNQIWKNMALTKKPYFVLPVRSHLALTKDDMKEIGLTIQELLS